MFRLIVVVLVIALSITPVLVAGSDTDSAPFMIYVDPVTGKYTKNKPDHDTTPQQTQAISTAADMPRPEPPVTLLSPAFLIAGALLLVCHILSRILVSTRK